MVAKDVTFATSTATKKSQEDKFKGDMTFGLLLNHCPTVCPTVRDSVRLRHLEEEQARRPRPSRRIS